MKSVASSDGQLQVQVTFKGGTDIDLASVQEDARKYVAGYKVPRELHIVDEVPRAPSGKPAYPKALEIALAGDHKVT